MSGKPFAIFFGLLLIIPIFYALSSNFFDKGRDYNLTEQLRVYQQKKPLENMKDLFYKKKERGEIPTSKELSELAENYEFFYFPNGLRDMRKVVICARYESLCRFKDMSGKFRKVPSSMGFLAMYGGELKIKMVPHKKAGETLNLVPVEKGPGHQLDPAYLNEDSEEKAQLISRKKNDLKKKISK